MKAPSVRPALDATGAGVMLLLCAIWAVQQVAAKLAVAGGMAPLAQAGLRSAGAAILVCVWVGLRQGRPGLARLVRRDHTLRAGLCVGIVFTAEFALLFEGVARTTASHAVLLLYTAPFFTAIGAHLFCPGERLHTGQVFGLLAAFAGVAIATGGGAGEIWGDAMVFASAGFWGATTVIVRATCLADERRHGSCCINSRRPACLLTFAAALGGDFMQPASGFAWMSVAYQTAIVSFASYLAWFWLLTRYSPRPLSAFTLLTPLLGIVAGALVLHEAVSAILILAFLLVAAGLRLVNGTVRSPAIICRDSA